MTIPNLFFIGSEEDQVILRFETLSAHQRKVEGMSRPDLGDKRISNCTQDM